MRSTLSGLGDLLKPELKQFGDLAEAGRWFESSTAHQFSKQFGPPPGGPFFLVIDWLLFWLPLPIRKPRRRNQAHGIPPRYPIDVRNGGLAE